MLGSWGPCWAYVGPCCSCFEPVLGQERRVPWGHLGARLGLCWRKKNGMLGSCWVKVCGHVGGGGELPGNPHSFHTSGTLRHVPLPICFAAMLLHVRYLTWQFCFQCQHGYVQALGKLFKTKNGGWHKAPKKKNNLKSRCWCVIPDRISKSTMIENSRPCQGVVPLFLVWVCFKVAWLVFRIRLEYPATGLNPSRWDLTYLCQNGCFLPFEWGLRLGCVVCEENHRAGWKRFGMSEHMADRMQERMSDRTPDQLSEYMYM